MNINNIVLWRYCRRIRNGLPCPQKLKKQIIRDIQTSLEIYLAENPNASYSQVEAHFGKPESIASAYVNDLDTGSLLHSMKIRHRVITIICCTVLVILLSWTVYITLSIYNQAMNFPAYIEIETGWTDELEDRPTENTEVVKYYP